jgi:hypothetical protein
VTARAQWTVSNRAIATVSTTGFVTVLGHGELDITPTYLNYIPTPQMWSVLADPQQSPRIFYFLSGSVRESDGSGITNATVEILDGYNAGKSAFSNGVTGLTPGYYRFDRVLTKETFTVRASKTGYVTSTTTYKVDGPLQFPGETNNPPFLDIRLSRVPQ